MSTPEFAVTAARHARAWIVGGAGAFFAGVAALAVLQILTPATLMNTFAIVAVLPTAVVLDEFRSKGGVAARHEPASSIATDLAALEASGYTIVHGVNTGRGKLDHVVVGPTGAFAIETKTWAGKVMVTGEPRLTVDGRDEHAAVRQVRGAAVDIQGRLSRAGVTPWVEAVLALKDAELPRARVPIPSERVTVVRASELVAFILGHEGALSEREIARARVALGAADSFAF